MASQHHLSGDFISNFYNKRMTKRPTLQVLYDGKSFSLSNGNHYIKGILSDDSKLKLPSNFAVIRLTMHNRIKTDDGRVLLEVRAYTQISTANAQIGDPKDIEQTSGINKPATLKRKEREKADEDSDYTNPQVRAKLAKTMPAKINTVNIQAVVMAMSQSQFNTQHRGCMSMTVAWVYTSERVIKIMSIKELPSTKTVGNRATGKKDPSMTLERLEVGKYYRFADLEDKQCDYKSGMQRELHVFENTSIELLSDDELPALPFVFTPLNELKGDDKGKAVAAVIVNVGDIVAGTSKGGNQYYRRDVNLADQTGVRMKLTLWSQNARSFMGMPGDHLVLHSTAVAKYKGYLSLEVTSNACLLLNPPNMPCDALQQWFESAVKDVDGVPIGLAPAREIPFMTIPDADAQLDDTREKVVFRSDLAIIHVDDDKFAYLACMSCTKKIDNNECKVHGGDCGEGRWLYKLIVQFKQGEIERTAVAFNEVGLKLFGISADELENLKNTNEAAFNAKFIDVIQKVYSCNIALDSKQADGVDVAQYIILSAQPM